MEQFLIEAIEALCVKFGYSHQVKGEYLSIRLKQMYLYDFNGILGHLNKLTGGSYSPNSNANQKLIMALYKKGYKAEDFKAVITTKCNEWLENAEMRKYLRPATLFNVNKFDVYFEQVNADKAAPTKTKMYDLLKDDWDE